MDEKNETPPADFFRALRDLLRDGLRRTPASYREKHVELLKRLRTTDGLFADRQGRPDPYYAAFALRSLSALEALTPEIGQAALENLTARRQAYVARPAPPPQAPFFNAVSAASFWDAVELCREVAEPPPPEELYAAGDETENALRRLRRPDGGWAKTPEEAGGSTYHAFLIFCVYGRLRRPLPRPADVTAFLQTMAAPDGGFRENAAVKKPGANATAAGLTLSFLLDAEKSASVHNSSLNVEGEKTPNLQRLQNSPFAPIENVSASPAAIQAAARHIAYLMSLRDADGGFHAAPTAPWTDLLSTFSVLSVLKPVLEISAPETWAEWSAAAEKFADTLEHPSGGYLGFALDPAPDAEYTFYGLGVKALAALGK